MTSSGRYLGVALLGAPGTGGEDLGAALSRIGFFPVDQTRTVVFGSVGPHEDGLVGFRLAQWTDALLRQAGGVFDAAVSADPDLRLRTTLDLAFADARECSRGAPLVLSDSRLTPLLRSWPPHVTKEFLPVLVLRNPLRIARFLRDTEGTALYQGLALWEICMTMVSQALCGSPVVTIDADSMMTSETVMQEFLSVLGRHFSVGHSPADLPRFRVDSVIPDTLAGNDGALEDFATEKQRRLWQSLCDLPLGPTTLSLPSDLLEPSRAALEALASASLHWRLKEAHETSLGVIQAMHEELHTERAEAQLLADELRRTQAQSQFLIEKVSELEGEYRERVEEFGARETEYREREEESARRSGIIEDLERSVREMQNSDTWRVGDAVLRPIRWVRSVVHHKGRIRAR